MVAVGYQDKFILSLQNQSFPNLHFALAIFLNLNRGLDVCLGKLPKQAGSLKILHSQPDMDITMSLSLGI